MSAKNIVEQRRINDVSMCLDSMCVKLLDFLDAGEDFAKDLRTCYEKYPTRESKRRPVMTAVQTGTLKLRKSLGTAGSERGYLNLRGIEHGRAGFERSSRSRK